MRLVALLLLTILTVCPAMAQTRVDDEAQVRSAVFDYVDALYRKDPELVRRSVSPELDKYGVSFPAEGGTRWSTMTYEQLLALADRYNAAGRDMAAEPREVEILSMEDRIAAARLTARWGVDYLLLARDDDGRWRIRQVLWQGRVQQPRAGVDD